LPVIGSADISQQRITPRTEPVLIARLAGITAGFVVFPKRLAGLFIEAIQDGLRAGAKVQEDAISRDDGRGAIAPDVMLLAQIRALPQLFAIHVVAKNAGGGMKHDHPLAIGRR
jgi:hypothetical protein